MRNRLDTSHQSVSCYMDMVVVLGLAPLRDRLATWEECISGWDVMRNRLDTSHQSVSCYMDMVVVRGLAPLRDRLATWEECISD